MPKVYREDQIKIVIDPYQLRRMADEMDKRMSKNPAVGERVWTETLRGEGVAVELIADQDWFQRRRDGIPNWEEMVPGPEALARFNAIYLEDSEEDPEAAIGARTKESREFPDTYSGAGWHAAFRIWRAAGIHGSQILANSENEIVDGAAKGLGLSGFQFGWAVNAVRQMLGFAPGTNPAILVVGGPQPVVPASGPPEKDMRRAIGGRDV